MVFITGGSGLIGQFIVKKLLAEGYQIKALTRQNPTQIDLQDDALEWVQGDLQDITTLEAHLQGITHIIHAAALVSFAPKDRKAMQQINVEGTRNLVNVALQYPLEKFCFISSIASLGRPKNVTILHENILWEDSDLNTFYGITKYLAEVEVWRGQAEGLKTVILNPSVVLGTGDWNSSSTQLFKYVWKEHLFYTQGTINAVDVRDVAEAVFRATFSAIEGERFILNAGSMPYKQFFEEIATHFDKKAPSRQINPFWAGVAWRIAYLGALLTGKKPFISRETATISQKSFKYDNQKAIKWLEMDFRPLSQSIAWASQELIKKYQHTKNR